MATINYNNGNVNVSFFPTNVNPIWFCDKNTGGINIATNGAAMTANTLQLGNAATTTILSGAVNASSMDSIGVTNNLELGRTQTTGTITIGDSLSRTGPIYVGNRTAGFISIGTAMTGANYITMGTLANSSTQIRGKSIEIGDNGGNVFIGKSDTNTIVNGNLMTNVLYSSSNLKINESTNLDTTINANANAAQSVTIGTTGKTTQYIRGATVNLCDGGGNVIVGNSTGTVTMTGTAIKQNVSCIGGGLVSNTFGNTDSGTSLSTTYSRKSTNTLTDLACYTILGPGIYTSGYFEIVISGSNQQLGGYSYKGFFGVRQTSSTTLTATPVSTLFSVGGNGIAPTITFTGTNPITLNINTATRTVSTSQTFIATLIAYPTITIDNQLNDFTITGI